MTGRARWARFARVEKNLGALPLRRSAVRKAFEHFRATGELPEESRLAEAVTRTAVYGEPPSDQEDVVSQIERLMLHARRRQALAAKSPTPTKRGATRTVRETLFHQAVHGEVLVRGAARVALMWLVREQHEDVTAWEFAAAYGLPRHNLVGLHILGWPENMAMPPYEAEGERLFTRWNALRDEIDYSDPEWFEPIAEAAARFKATGELRGADVCRDSVLVMHQFGLLFAHLEGQSVAKAMAAIDRVWRSAGEEREAAVGAAAKVLHRRATRREPNESSV